MNNYQVTLYILNPDFPEFEHAPSEWQNDCYELLRELEKLPELQVEIPKTPQTGKKDVVESLKNIILYGTSIGAFSAIYALAKDILARHRNATLKLVFASGGEMTLTGLSESEAKKKMEEHLKDNSIAIVS